MKDIFFQFVLKTLVIIISTSAVSFFFFLVYNHNYEVYHKSIQNKEIVVRLPKAFIFVGFIVSIVGIAFIIFGIKVNGETIADIAIKVFMLIIGGALLLLGIAISYSSVFFRIIIMRGSETFEYRTAFGRTHIIRYDEIEKIIHRKDEMIFKAHNRYFIVDRSAENSQIFFKMLRIYCKENINKKR